MDFEHEAEELVPYLFYYLKASTDFPRMWLMPGRASGRKTLLQYSSLTLLEKECYEEEGQPYRKTDYKLMVTGCNEDYFDK